MTRLLDEAIKRLAELPADRQDEAARLILERFRPPEPPEVDGAGEPYRRIGWLAGWEIPDSFFEPLDDELLELFEGKALGEQIKALGLGHGGD